MNDLIRKLRECDNWLEAIVEDPNFHKVLACGDDSEKDIETFREFKRTVYLMRASARMQQMEDKKAEAEASV